MGSKKAVPQIRKEEVIKVKENLALDLEQINFFLRRTPSIYTRKRPAKGGGQWTYVSGGYVKKVLNLAFGWDWDFEIIDEIVNLEARQVIVKGRLTVRSNGKSIVKMQGKSVNGCIDLNTFSVGFVMRHHMFSKRGKAWAKL